MPRPSPRLGERRNRPISAAALTVPTTPLRTNPRARLIVALDLPGVDEAAAMVARIGDACAFYKIGHQLLFTGGETLVRALVSQGRQVFVDAKLLDIGETVAKGTASIADLGATFLTVHAQGHAVASAVRGRGASPLKILAVTVLTDHDDRDLAADGVAGPVSARVLARAKAARAAGADGIVCSPNEAAAIRAALGPEPFIVTPGVRPAGADVNDQKRVATPAAAIKAGATHLVVGRPITGAADPRAAAQAIQDEIAGALAS